MILLITPAMAWIWLERGEAATDELAAPAVRRNLPVEIIPSDTAPQWILVPIAPH